jgi:predicted nucleic acid-binding protein
MKIVFDSSTLILLAKTNLLRAVSAEVDIILPEEVQTGCLIKKTADAELISLLIQERKIGVQKAIEAKAVKKLQIDFRLAKGEAEALWLSRKLNCPVAIDDGPGIKASKVLGLPFLTAVHFLLHLASRNELSLELAREKLTKLSRYGRYGNRIIEDAMHRLQEGRK